MSILIGTLVASVQDGGATALIVSCELYDDVCCVCVCVCVCIYLIPLLESGTQALQPFKRAPFGVNMN